MDLKPVFLTSLCLYSLNMFRLVWLQLSDQTLFWGGGGGGDTCRRNHDTIPKQILSQQYVWVSMGHANPKNHP